jgi:hypothetical protein
MTVQSDNCGGMQSWRGNYYLLWCEPGMLRFVYEVIIRY